MPDILPRRILDDNIRAAAPAMAERPGESDTAPPIPTIFRTILPDPSFFDQRRMSGSCRLGRFGIV